MALAPLLGCSFALAQSENSLVDLTRQTSPAARELTVEARGDILMARKMYREAIEVFQSDSHKSAVVENKIGIAYHQLQQLDQARKSYERALKLKPDYAEAVNNLGTIYYAKKSYRRAVSQYLKALRLNPNNAASIYSNLGTAYFARKKYEEATMAYSKAMSLDPDVFERRSSYGTLLEDRNVEERAKFHYYLAKMYAKAGRNELALQNLRKALEEGFKERKKINEDPEFDAMRSTPEFQELLTAEPRVL
jgi:tetratricopeptide (TPR) repeat protein